MSDDESFLGRWSRLKREQAQPIRPGQDAQPASGSTELPGQRQATPAREGGSEVAAPAAEPEQLDLSRLPKLDELTADTDFSVFLDKRVPAGLRNAALRQMWTLDPGIRDFIEVAEMQWNWNVPGDAPGYEAVLEGADLPALLAQATGAVERVWKSTGDGDHESVMAAATNAPGLAADGSGRDASDAALPDHEAAARIPQPPAAPQNPGSRLGLTEPSAPSAAAAAPAAMQQVAGQTEDAEPAPAKRHGGALPF